MKAWSIAAVLAPSLGLMLGACGGWTVGRSDLEWRASMVSRAHVTRLPHIMAVKVPPPDLHELLVGCKVETVSCEARRSSNVLDVDAASRRFVECDCIEERRAR